MSEGLAAGEIFDILDVADSERPEISVLSDRVPGLHRSEGRAARTSRCGCSRSCFATRSAAEATQARRRPRSSASRSTQSFAATRHGRFQAPRWSSASSRSPRAFDDARRRHEQLGLTDEEAAFYDALAGGVEAKQADPQLASIAHDLVQSIRADLTVDWADRESSEAAIRVKIKRLLRKHNYKPSTQPSGGGGPDDLNHYTQLLLDQAKALYRYWPEVEDRLFD